MPKVLRIINRLNLGGPTYNAAYLSKYLYPEYETMLVAGMRDESEASSEFIVRQMKLDPVYISDMYRSINPLKDRKAYDQIVKLIRHFKPDIVHTHAAKSGAIGRLAAANNKVPVIVHTFHGHIFHSYFNPLKTRLFLEIERYLAKKSTRLIAISDLQKKELTQNFKIAHHNKFEVIPLGFDLTRFATDQEEKRKIFRKDYGIKDNEIAIGIIGRLVPVKDHSLFITAFKKVLERSSKPVRAFIVGDGEERERLLNLTKELKLEYATPDSGVKNNASLIFTSWIKEVDYVNAGMDIIALTSKNEGTPVSLIEAQAANKPIVSTNIGGIADVVEAGVTALLSPPGDLETLSKNLLHLIEDDDFRNAMACRGHDLSLTKFHYQTLIKNTRNLYNNLLERL